MRHPATKGKADSNHKAIREAIELLGFPVMDLHAAGNGVEDLLVGMRRRVQASGGPWQYYWWLVCEVKNLEGRGERYTDAQLKWRKLTEGWPRITVTSAQDAVEQIRRMTG